jgi:serine phosphatase RsbU (regulator of sigma subunit)
VENARLYREREEVAEVLQRGLVPTEPPRVPFAEVASYYRPLGSATAVGGDFYDVFRTPDGAWAFVIGDVCGKGPRVAAMSALARHAIRAIATTERRPQGVMRRLNTVLLGEEPWPQLCTSAYLRAAQVGGEVRVRVCLAGHPAPLLIESSGEVRELGAHGTLLGFTPTPSFTETVDRLQPGDTVVMFTDGLFHGRDSEEERAEFQRRLVEAAGGSAKDVCAAAERWVMEHASPVLRDDVALLAIKIQGEDAGAGSRGGGANGAAGPVSRPRSRGVSQRRLKEAQPWRGCA